MDNIRRSAEKDIVRLAEIEIFNYRLNFYPVFQDDNFYFGELQVQPVVDRYKADLHSLENIYVYDDGVVKGFVKMQGTELQKLFVEPVLQGQGIGAKLLEFAVQNKGVVFLWALEKNKRAVAFYERYGFHVTSDKKLEDDTTEYLVRLVR